MKYNIAMFFYLGFDFEWILIWTEMYTIYYVFSVCLTLMFLLQQQANKSIKFQVALVVSTFIRL